MDDRNDLFWEVASIDYPIIDADAHVNEPPNLWLDRIPAKYRQRAPRVERTDQGDAWVFDDGKLQMHIGLTGVAGRSYLDYSNKNITYEDLRPGSWDTKARLADLDIDGIWGQVMYPSITLTGAKIYGDEPDLQHACVRAYNEWMLEFCDGSGGRLIPQAIMPACGTERAIEELEWAIANGHHGAILSAFPNGSLDHKPEDDRFFGIAQEAGFPVAVHIGSFSARNTSQPSGEWNTLQFIGLAIAPRCGGGVIETTLSLIFSGIFEKFPRLKMLLVESNISWIPGLLEQSDDMFQRYRWFTGAVDEMRTMPSRIFHRNFWVTFMLDAAGLEMRHHMNLDHLMFSTDYPHSATDWPATRVTIDKLFRGMPRAQVRRMLRDNAVELYGLKDVPEVLT
jgi:predicted TIM-barrel fold metal-dependent hydrolase